MKFFLIPQIVLFLSFSKAAEGQSSYFISHFGQNEGLNQNSINYILPDRYGFAYIATEGGVLRFSGNEFIPLEYDQNFSGIKKSGRTQRLIFKAKDTVLAFSSESPSAQSITTILGNRILSVKAYDPIKDGLFFSNDSTINSYSFKKKGADIDSLARSLITITRAYSSSYGYYSGIYNKDTMVITKVLEQGGREFVFFTGEGVCKTVGIEGSTAQIFKISGHLINIDRDNKVNFYTTQGLTKSAQLNFAKKYRQLSYVANSFSQDIFIIADSDLMRLAISENGVPEIKFVLHDNELQQKETSFFWENGDGRIVCATGTNGIYVYKKKALAVSERILPAFKNNFYSQVLFGNDKTIFSNGFLFTNNSVVEKRDPGLPDTDIFDFCFKDHKGNYWRCSNYKRQVLKYDSNFRHPQIIAANSPWIYGVYEDNDHVFWIPTEMGLGRYTQGNFTWSNYLNPQHKADSETIQCITQDKNHNYWVGANSGVYELDYRTKKLLKKINSLSGYVVRFIKCDGEDVWICTYGGGMFLLHDNVLTPFAKKNNALAYVHYVVEDNQKRFWLPTNNGLFVVDKNALIDYAENKNMEPFFYRFSISDGLRTNEFNGGDMTPFLQFADGTISLSSLDGLVSFNSNNIKLDFSNSPILIEKVLRDTTEIFAKSGLFTVENGSENIRFHVSTSFWGNKKNLQLEYQFVSENESLSEPNWVKVDESQIISIRSPAHGHYKLSIRKRTGLSNQDIIYETFSIDILPAWYQTITFYVVSLLLVLSIIIAYYEWRFNQQQKNREYLEGRIQQATYELKTANSELKYQDRAKTKLISIFTHDISIPMQFIHKVIKYQVENLQADSPLKNNLEEIMKSTDQLILMTDNILNWMRSQQRDGSFKPDKHHFSLFDLFTEKWKLVSSIAARKEIALILTIPVNYEIMTDRYIFGTILYNILSNSVKFTSKGSITVSITETDNEVLLQIVDTGKGIPNEKLEQIEKLLSVTSEAGTSGEEGKGIGLILIKELTAMLGLKITISSLLGVGTKTTLAIPIEKKE